MMMRFLNSTGIFRFKKTRQPQAGAEAYAFYNGQRNPTFLISGHGLQVREGVFPLQEPPMYYPTPLMPLAGIGGPIAGTIYGIPLYVPPQLRSGT